MNALLYHAWQTHNALIYREHTSAPVIMVMKRWPEYAKVCVLNYYSMTHDGHEYIYVERF